MHELAEQIERITMMLLLLLFGGALMSGMLAPLTWIDAGALPPKSRARSAEPVAREAWRPGRDSNP